jgi:hypothetical protein
MQKKCVSCGVLIHGRIDKRFCSDYCRNKFHNGLKSHESQFIRKVNYILRKNRRILIEFKRNEEKRLTKLNLIRAGFDFNFITSVKKDKRGKICYFCYEQGIILDQKGKLIPIQHEIGRNPEKRIDFTDNISG